MFTDQLKKTGWKNMKNNKIQNKIVEDDLGFLNLAWDLEAEWKRSLPRLSDEELLKLFPQAKPVLKQRLKGYQKEMENLAVEIRQDLSRIYEIIKDEFSVWFFEKIIEIWKGERLNWLSKEVKKIKWALNFENFGEKGSEITDETIQRAKEYPFEQLIKFNRAKKALCVFHREKHPSLSLNLKTNRIKCFGCGINYDPIEYLMKTQNLSFIESVKYLNNY
jgi:hypothetical protein